MYSNYLEPRFTFREVADAAAFPLNTLRSNYQRGWFKTLAKTLPAGRGKTRRLCLGDVLVLAIASRLIDQGERPLNAYNAAIAFGLVARTPKGMSRRRPFELFDRRNYDTYFLWRRGSAPVVIPVEKGAPVTVDFGLDEEGRLFGVATTVILLNAVEATVLRALGLEPLETSNDS